MAGRLAFGIGGGLSALGSSLIDDTEARRKLADQRDTSQMAFNRAQAADVFNKIGSGALQPEQGQAMLQALGVQTPLDALKSFRPGMDTVTRGIEEKMRAATTPETVPTREQMESSYAPYRVTFQNPEYATGPGQSEPFSPTNQSIAANIDRLLGERKTKFGSFEPKKIGESITGEGTPQAQTVANYSTYDPDVEGGFVQRASVPQGGTAGGQADVQRRIAEGTALGQNSEAVANAKAKAYAIETPNVVARTGQNAFATQHGTNRAQIADQVALRSKLFQDEVARGQAGLVTEADKVLVQKWAEKQSVINDASNEGLIVANQMQRLMPAAKKDLLDFGAHLNSKMKGAIVDVLNSDKPLTEQQGLIGNILGAGKNYVLPQGLRIYMQDLAPKLGTLAKMSGQVGNLNEGEQARAKLFFPTAQDFLEGTADAKIQRFRALAEIMPKVHELNRPDLVNRRGPDFHIGDVIGDMLDEQLAYEAQAAQRGPK